jgi:predicted sulfurtransferase
MVNVGEQDGVLLYYKYCELADSTTALAAWLEKGCARLGLRGRVRVARDGVNATLRGSMPALQVRDTTVAAIRGPSQTTVVAEEEDRDGGSR